MFSTSISGIHQNIEMFLKHAGNLQDIEKADLPDDIIGMTIAEHGVTANANALKVNLRLQDSIIDMIV